jgi:thiol-disulfide isomerase/thioredoxin
VTLAVERRLPGFDGAAGWLNSPPLGADDVQGKVVLVDFWTYTCINWLRTLGYVRAWSERYAGDGLVVVGVHTPEFPFERDADNVRESVQELNVGYPVALDPEYTVWEAFENRYWPAVYVADRDGLIRYEHFGEGAYDETERTLQRLLGVDGALSDVSPDGVETQADWEHLQSPETYVGYQQGRNLASPERAETDERRTYSVPDELPLNTWALGGEWTIEGRASVSNEPGDRIAFRFHGRDVNLVLRSRTGTPVPFRVRIDGEAPGDAHGLDIDERGDGTLVRPRLYQLVRERDSIEDRTFEIEFLEPGAEAYVFTFG